VAYVVEIAFRGTATERLRFGEAHRSYWKRMAEQGFLLGGGPWRDGTGELLLCEAGDRGAVLKVLYADPYTQSHVIGDIRVREWDAVMGHVLLAGLERAGSGAGAGPLELIPGGAAGPYPDRRGPQPRRRTAARDELTAHEVRIASMMLDGMTNKQIAGAFAVSTRAVELHITRIYRKLDIRRRAQLAAAMGRAPVAIA
jgi:DNA-binding CsgD family transcriptional regulator/uncharacterized protein YciI